MEASDFESELSRKTSRVRLLAREASRSCGLKARLAALTRSADRTVAVNALWVMTHMVETDGAWLASLRDSLADMLLAEADPSKKRLLLKILREQTYAPEDIRTDLLDFCLSKINSEAEPYAVRASCIYLAFKMSRAYPELVGELREYLAMLSLQALSPGLASARRRVLAAISRLEKAGS